MFQSCYRRLPHPRVVSCRAEPFRMFSHASDAQTRQWDMQWESEWTEWQWVSIHVMVINWHDACYDRAGNKILSSLKD